MFAFTAINNCMNYEAQKYYNVTLAGRRGVIFITLDHVLQSVTGTDEEPVLGFELLLSLNFTEVSNSFVPTACW